MGINGFFLLQCPKNWILSLKKGCFGHYRVDLPVCCPQNFQNVGMSCAFFVLYAQNHLNNRKNILNLGITMKKYAIYAHKCSLLCVVALGICLHRLFCEWGMRWQLNFVLLSPLAKNLLNSGCRCDYCKKSLRWRVCFSTKQKKE